MPLPLIPIALGLGAGIVGTKIASAISDSFVLATPVKVGKRTIHLEDYLFEDSCGNYCEYADMDEDDQNAVLAGIARGEFDL